MFQSESWWHKQSHAKMGKIPISTWLCFGHQAGVLDQTFSLMLEYLGSYQGAMAAVWLGIMLLKRLTVFVSLCDRTVLGHFARRHSFFAFETSLLFLLCISFFFKWGEPIILFRLSGSPEDNVDWCFGCSHTRSCDFLTPFPNHPLDVAHSHSVFL